MATGRVLKVCLGVLGAALVGLLGVGACGGTDISGGYGGGGPACSSCYEVYVNGGIACGPGSAIDAWHELANSCACGTSKCVAACSASFCQNLPADMACSTCLAGACLAAEMNCANN